MLRNAATKGEKMIVERWHAMSMPGNEVCLRNGDIASDTVINWALACRVTKSNFPNVVQVGEPSEAGTEMVPSSSSLGMPVSPS